MPILQRQYWPRTWRRRHRYSSIASITTITSYIPFIFCCCPEYPELPRSIPSCSASCLKNAPKIPSWVLAQRTYLLCKERQELKKHICIMHASPSFSLEKRERERERDWAKQHNRWDVAISHSTTITYLTNSLTSSYMFEFIHKSIILIDKHAPYDKKHCPWSMIESLRYHRTTTYEELQSMSSPKMSTHLNLFIIVHKSLMYITKDKSSQIRHQSKYHINVIRINIMSTISETRHLWPLCVRNPQLDHKRQFDTNTYVIRRRLCGYGYK